MNAASTLNTFSLKQVNRMRHDSPSLVEVVGQTVEKLVELENKDDLHVLLSTYFSNSKVLRAFFDKYPSAWWDLLRKLSKYKKEKGDDGRSVYIDETHTSDILETLLIRWRKENTWVSLQAEMRANLNNPALIRFASKQPSILDGSGYSFSKIPKKQRTLSIEKLIIAWLTNNIDKCDTSNYPAHFSAVFPRLLYYLGKVFWLQLDALQQIKNPKDFAIALSKMFDDPEKVEDAFMVIQSFYAWPRVLEIEELCNDAKSEIGKMGHTLSKVWIRIDTITTEHHITGTTLYHAELLMGGKKYQIDWRVKTPESILQKMWQKMQYNNVDAMRDIIGMNIIYPDSATDEDKKELITAFSNLMPDYGYILKNKWAVSRSEWLTENLKKKPMAINEKKSEMTHGEFTNMSLSGYMKLWNSPYGAEIQFISESEAREKKKEDPYYKLRWALDAFFRGPKYRHPSALYNFIQARVIVPYLQSLWCANFWDLFWKLISEEYIIAYRFANNNQFVFSVKWRESAMSEIFPDANKITPESLWYEDLRDYVRNDYRMMHNDELAKPKTSSRPPSLDRL